MLSCCYNFQLNTQKGADATGSAMRKQLNNKSNKKLKAASRV